MEKYFFDQCSGLWYEHQGDYYISRLVLDETDTSPVGMWGRKHQQYLKEHRPMLYSNLILSGRLHSHLTDIDTQARSKLHLLVTQLAEKEGINEQRKAQIQMAWVGAMNNICNRAKNIKKVIADLKKVYAAVTLDEAEENLRQFGDIQLI